MSTVQHSTYCTVWTPTSKHNVSTYISLPAVTKQVAFISHRLQREQRSSPTPSPERYRSVKLNSRTTRCKSTDKIYTEFSKLLIFCKVVSFFCIVSLPKCIWIHCNSVCFFSQLQIHYDKQLGNLIVHVLQARNLVPRDNNGYSDPFVKVYLLPGRGWVKGVETASTR